MSVSLIRFDEETGEPITQADLALRAFDGRVARLPAPGRGSAGDA